MRTWRAEWYGSPDSPNAGMAMAQMMERMMQGGMMGGSGMMRGHGASLWFEHAGRNVSGYVADRAVPTASTTDE